ncbi:MAG: hypothetical protein KTR32_28795 [Granulosicoccus sp.]|nr:hypothetical protein [Granulosicoccus sp.]
MRAQLYCLLLLLAVILVTNAARSEPACAAESRITSDFDNGASWDLCWESRIRENLVLRDIHYSLPDGGETLRVLSSARLSQLHVAYDDSDVTYNDVTQYGLGGAYLLELTEADCPFGRLLEIQTRPALCVWQTQADAGYRTPTRAALAQSLNLFSVSQVGAYAYITSWTFYDDGSFEPGVGATGALQRSSTSVELPFGRILQGDPDTLWLSHTHNYYWRLDFDLGNSANDDVVSEVRYITNSEGMREQQTIQFITEQARRIDPATQLFWRISASDQRDAIAYQLEPNRSGHRYERKEIEPYSDFDFFVTVNRDCERFASQNTRYNPECQNNVLEFVDNQSLYGQDLVVWNRVSFHHVPRSEDQRHMHTHWDGFMIRPVNLQSSTPGLAGIENQVPRLPDLSNRNNRAGDLIHETLSGVDADGDVLSYQATGLPGGVAMDIAGHLHGEITQQGEFSVTVTAFDDHSQVSESFLWSVSAAGPENDAPNSADSGNKSRMGSTGYICLLILAACFLVRNKTLTKPCRFCSHPPLR